MILTVVLIVISTLALLFLVVVARGRALAVSDVSQLPGRTQPVDLAAFRNLVDPDEEEYLRQNLSPEEFRKIHRERLWAASEYVQCVAKNAAILLRLGEAARRSDDPQVAEAGQQLVNSALRVRVTSLIAQAKLYAGIRLPGVGIPPIRISDSYENLTGDLSRLGHLQHYARSANTVTYP